MAYIFYTVLFALVFVLTCIHCEMITTEYHYRTNLDDSVCTDSQILFVHSVRSKIACMQLCTAIGACFGVFYNKAALTCTLCTGYNHVEDQTGNIFMIKLNRQLLSNGSEGYCEPPVFYDHANLGHVYGRYLQGYQLAYTCTQCTYFGVITCQHNGAWATPSCVYGPDVGMLRDGQLIPTGSVGCFLSYGSRCLAYSDPPHVNNGLKANGHSGQCWCDSECCRKGDCCFDVDC